MIRFMHSDGVVCITLARPATRNALTMADWHALATAPQHCAGARAAVLMADEAGQFCSGSDLRAIAALADDAAARAPFREAMRAALDALAGLPIPLIAAIDGDCMGAGVALALCADVRLASTRARFAVPPARLGIGYPQADVARLARLVGHSAAARLLFTAATIDAAEAARIGLIEPPCDAVCDAALAMAATIAANAPDSVAVLKRALAQARLDPDPALDAAFDQGFGSDAFREGLAAFRERRPPRF